MRISDWSSDVCSSDLGFLRDRDFAQVRLPQRRSAHHREHRSRNASQYTRVRALSVAPPQNIRPRAAMPGARRSVVSGQSVSVRVDLGGRRLIQKKITQQQIIVYTYQSYITNTT